ncbi:pyridoxamine 5'-phosphate oxidase family protein [Alkaliphilus serpentinus]|uniref:Pyridoxamine 5'-phosphate oxidase family protein n=1 Tax=Alkaliphilus serpentinus TaxID=1482731 RepID=A0A833HQ26_9FIRM|nr:pyridoxamine 5'-phosphate oxidase family protein [Alkaliphilus serpentinus]KAB3530443.1 pyridoxamine 5'-phosphate oxidase family protein [Alkaliphilus serpentinus]
MKRPMRRSDREISYDGAIEVLRKGRVGTLSTVGEDGQPYGIPLNYVYFSNAIYFHCGMEGHKLDNINFNKRVCFSVYGRDEILPERFSTKYESVVVFGRAEVVEALEKKEALMEFIRIYSHDYIEKGMKYIDAAIDRCLVVKIVMDKVSGKAANLDL